MVADPKESHWINRDRFVLSNGHACALQYIMLHLMGYDLTMDDLKAFRQLDSRTPGHPEVHHTDGVEVTTAGGLMLSPPGDLVGVSPTRLSGRGREVQSPTGLFNLAGWRRGPSGEFNKLRQEVQRAVVAAPEAERDRARMDLAHFYFTQLVSGLVRRAL